jgi:hypothetical protein
MMASFRFWAQASPKRRMFSMASAMQCGHGDGEQSHFLKSLMRPPFVPTFWQEHTGQIGPSAIMFPRL